MAIDSVLLRFKISRKSFVSIELNGVVTREGIEKLIEVLNLLQDTYPKESEIAIYDTPENKTEEPQ